MASEDETHPLYPEVRDALIEFFKSRDQDEDCTCEFDEGCWYHLSHQSQLNYRTEALLWRVVRIIEREIEKVTDDHALRDGPQGDG